MGLAFRNWILNPPLSLVDQRDFSAPHYLTHQPRAGPLFFCFPYYVYYIFVCSYTSGHLSFYFVIASIAPPAVHETQPRFNFAREVIWTSPLVRSIHCPPTHGLTTYGSTVSHVFRQQRYLLHVVLHIWRPAFGGHYGLQLGETLSLLHEGPPLAGMTPSLANTGNHSQA